MKTSMKEGNSKGKLNEVITKVTERPDGTFRYQQDFTNCPTLTEQHTAHLTNINYLIEKYKPDELAAYIAARNQYRQEILGHDFSSEPDFQQAKNIQLNFKKDFEDLPEEIQKSFKNPLEFLKFMDNPQNAEKMIKLGLLTQKEAQKFTGETDAAAKKTQTSTTKEEKDKE